MERPWVVPPPSMPVANEGLGWDSLLKMVHNPGGDWNPGRGDNPRETLKFTQGFHNTWQSLSMVTGIVRTWWTPIFFNDFGWLIFFC